MKFYYLIISIIFLTSCSSTKKLNGKYRSNKAELGFFVTEINFENDNVFKYKFSGDLQHTELTGTYIVKNKNAYLKFNKPKGQIETQSDSLTVVEILNGNYHNYDLKNESNFDYHLKYRVKGNKLFSYRIDNGKLVTKSKSYSNTKMFLLFGSKWKTTRSYLKKIK
jgi:hypothetical protein